MRAPIRWVDDDNAVLLTDLYELTMLESYYAEGLVDEAVFSLFFRRLPPRRNFAVACGLDDVLALLERLSFSAATLDELARLGMREPFLRRLEGWRFTGDVYAMAEGTVAFADEPLLEIVAPLPEAQLVETLVLNQMHFATTIASKAARAVLAACGRRVVDFGLRRAHGADAGLKSARSAFVAGVDATSNVLAGVAYGIPVAGTMAHSYIEAHASERDAFRAFLGVHPRATLLIDTYDTLGAAQLVVELAREGFRAGGVRLDSGNLAVLARTVRWVLDDGGLNDVEIVASGGLDEGRIATLLDEGAPIDVFGVGTALDVADDAPALDMAYKLVSYAGLGRLKTSAEKQTLPGRKQVFRHQDGDGVFDGDVIACASEHLPGEPLLERVMEHGHRTDAGCRPLRAARARALEQMARLPSALRAIGRANPYPVRVSALLELERRAALERVERSRRTDAGFEAEWTA